MYRKEFGLPILADDEQLYFWNDGDLVEMPNLPKKLKDVVVRGNKIRELPDLHDGLEGLDVSSNLIVTLYNYIPDSLYLLFLANNPLKYIGADNFEKIKIINNKWINPRHRPFFLMHTPILENVLLENNKLGCNDLAYDSWDDELCDGNSNNCITCIVVRQNLLFDC